MKTIKGGVFEQQLAEISAEGAVTFHSRKARLRLDTLDEEDRLEVGEDVHFACKYHIYAVREPLFVCPTVP